MTPSVHTTITYGLDTGTIYALIVLGWIAMMLYYQKLSGCADEDNSNGIGDSSIHFKPDELVSADDFSNSIDALLNNLNNHEVEKIGILHRDTLCAVAITHEYYQRLLHCTKLFETKEAHDENSTDTHRQ
jgi:hypothetical protein